jgi:cytidine deaminase
MVPKPSKQPEEYLSGDPLKSKDGPELVIGVVAPVGAKLTQLCNVIETELTKFGYSSEVIRLSKLLTELKPYAKLRKKKFPSEYERVMSYMKAGTGLRTLTARGDIMALLAVSKICEIREQKNKKNRNVPAKDKSKSPLHRTAYILRSLKHPDEIATLRSVYGRAFLLISAYAPRENRIDTLAEIIARSAKQSDTSAFRKQAEELIWIDEQEQGTKLGQNVSDGFPLADLFVDTQLRERVEESVRRYLELIFGHPFHTPTRDEYAMFHAKAAALRSADLSRQVGAAISTKDGDIVAVGCNEVPRAFGGLYWSDDQGDDRDFRRGYDSSVKSKSDILAEILEKFAKGGWLSAKKKKQSVPSLVNELMHGSQGGGDGILRDTQIVRLLEFGRPVHAEMAALTEAARRGVGVKNCTLYTTTFPCHMCARHIIASGIDRVVYIEPYPKSATKDLYSDSVAIDAPYAVTDRIKFEAFVGIAPIRYMTLFEISGKRKNSKGNAIEWIKVGANPRIKRFVLSYLLIEDEIVGDVLPRLLEEKGVKWISAK